MCCVPRIFDGVIVYITQQDESQQVKNHRLPSVVTSYNKHYVTSKQTDAVNGAKTQTIRNMNITQLQCMLTTLLCDFKQDKVQGKSVSMLKDHDTNGVEVMFRAF